MKTRNTGYQEAKGMFLKLQKVIEISFAKTKQDVSQKLMYLMFRIYKSHTKLTIKQMIDSYLDKNKDISRSKLEVKFSKLLKQGMDAGFLLKTCSESDKRIKYIEITNKGIKYLKTVDKLFEKEWRKIYG